MGCGGGGWHGLMQWVLSLGVARCVSQVGILHPVPGEASGGEGRGGEGWRALIDMLESVAWVDKLRSTMTVCWWNNLTYLTETTRPDSCRNYLSYTLFWTPVSLSILSR